MYTSQVDFLLIDRINHALKEASLPYEVHAYSGCAACGLHLVFQEDTRRKEALAVINKVLKTKWLAIVENEQDPAMLYVKSTFE